MVSDLKQYVLKWELTGIIFVFVVGAIAHFLFAWSGQSRVVGAFTSVNESVWEHFKQGFFPMCLLALIESIFPKMRVNNFLVAKAAAVYLIPIVTGLVFYSYTAVLGKEILAVDILIFLGAVSLGQLASYRIMTAAALPKYAGIIAGILIILLASTFIITTFRPPHLPIFLDGNTGTYGLPP